LFAGIGIETLLKCAVTAGERLLTAVEIVASNCNRPERPISRSFPALT
jgi:hypothetical protein